MVLGSVSSTRSRLGSVLAAAALTVALAACGSDAPDTPTATTAAETATTAAATTVAEATTTTAAEGSGDSALARIATMEDCDTLATTKRISQADLDGATADSYKKLYGDRVAAVTERMTELDCPAS